MDFGCYIFVSMMLLSIARDMGYVIPNISSDSYMRAIETLSKDESDFETICALNQIIHLDEQYHDSRIVFAYLITTSNDIPLIFADI